MRIAFCTDSCLFKNKTKAQIINSIPKYKNYYKTLINEFIKEVGINSKYINAVAFVTNKSSYGTTNYFIKDENIYFEIEITDELLPYISSIQNSTEKFKAKSVIQHELFHCIEIEYLYEHNILSHPNPLDDNFEITTTYNFLYDEAVKLWSEFYAVYNNRSINEWHEIPDVRINIIEINRWFLATKELSQNKVNGEIRMCKDMIKSLHAFWYNMIYMIALYIKSDDSILIEDYIKSDIDFIKEYFEIIYKILKLNIDFYPLWLSEENYIQLGKSLISIMRFYHLDFSTDDLSDNFVLQKIN